MKVCRVCGKEYEACRSMNQASNVFRWQDVSCSPECGAVYLRRIRKSRKKSAEQPQAQPEPKPVTVKREPETAAETSELPQE